MNAVESRRAVATRVSFGGTADDAPAAPARKQRLAYFINCIPKHI